MGNKWAMRLLGSATKRTLAKWAVSRLPSNGSDGLPSAETRLDSANLLKLYENGEGVVKDAKEAFP